MRGVPMNAEEPGHHHRHRLCAGEPPPPARRPSLSGLVKQTQHLSRHLSTTSTVAAMQAENARLHALVSKTALDNHRLILRVMSTAVPDEEVAASPALVQMLRDQLTRLEEAQVGHEVERLADPEAAKYATAAAAVTTSGNADLHVQVSEHENEQHTRASIIYSSSDAGTDAWGPAWGGPGSSTSGHIWFLPLLCCVCVAWFWAGTARQRSIDAASERLALRRKVAHNLVLEELTGGSAHAHDHEAKRRDAV